MVLLHETGDHRLVAYWVANDDDSA